MEIDRPLRKDGEWWFDVRTDRFVTNVSWKASRGFGIYLGEVGFGDRPDELYTDPALVALRVQQLAADAREGGRAEPMVVAEVRKLLGHTQVEVAEALTIGQGSVSRLEARRNPTLSALRAYVEAMGGELEVRARFRDLDVPIALPDSEVEA
ncbi:helix-turn-helix domain-containing protein [Roseomonas chloroacetimidivorans]|uniref:helix-turn-helix domain-containing protein n=1 Tax=Roseomonas chloroacetimidivorans TaxID=1766656 RepID=UPI003C7164C2